MPGFDIRRIDHPAAWKATDFPSKDSFAIDLTARQLSALEDALARLKKTVSSHADVTADKFPLVAIRDDVEAWRHEVQDGRGLLLLRGVPVERIPLDDLRLMYLGLGTYFGRPVSQSNLGDLVGDVVDVGGKDKRERAYRNSRELQLHTDRCDHIGMLCIRRAAAGGSSGYASAVTIHNEMLAERPDLLECLYNGFHHHRFGEQPEGEPVVTRERIPIFSMADGVMCAIYIRGYIDLAVEEGHVTLSAAETEALACLDRIANRPDVRLDFMMEPGDLAFVNNCLVFHTRTAFEDAADPALKRLLLRLWLRQDNRPSAPGVIAHKGTAGIEKRDGKGTYYTPSAVA